MSIFEGVHLVGWLWCFTECLIVVDRMADVNSVDYVLGTLVGAMLSVGWPIALPIMMYCRKHRGPDS